MLRRCHWYFHYYYPVSEDVHPVAFPCAHKSTARRPGKSGGQDERMQHLMRTHPEHIGGSSHTSTHSRPGTSNGRRRAPQSSSLASVKS